VAEPAAGAGAAAAAEGSTSPVDASMTDRMAGAALRRSRLGSGLRVVTEHLPGLRSVAVGF